MSGGRQIPLVTQFYKKTQLLIVKYLFIAKTTGSHLTIGTNSCEVPAIEQFENPVHTATRSDNPASGVGMHQSKLNLAFE